MRQNILVGDVVMLPYGRVDTLLRGTLLLFADLADRLQKPILPHRLAHVLFAHFIITAPRLLALRTGDFAACNLQKGLNYTNTIYLTNYTDTPVLKALSVTRFRVN